MPSKRDLKRRIDKLESEVAALRQQVEALVAAHSPDTQWEQPEPWRWQGETFRVVRPDAAPMSTSALI